MKEVKKCSISGVAFTLDTDAYEALESYLESLKKTYKQTPDGAEIVADIEARIAELILSAQDNARVVERPLIMNIIQQLGSVEDIAEQSIDQDLHSDTPRIPRRLYRDTENARLGGVCSGIGRYFDIDPVWIRLGMFLPLLLSGFGWVHFLHWTGPMMGNLFGIFIICYVIMWFAVPAARSARQKLEMSGEKITAQSISETTSAAACEPDYKARPIVAEAVSVFGKVVLICLKLFAGLLVFGLIMGACALIIGMIAVMVGGHEFSHLGFLENFSLWLPILGILVVLIPVILLIYVLMCLIASRKPGGKTVLFTFLLWLASIIACTTVAIRENVGEQFRRGRRNVVERVLHSPITVDGDTTSLEQLLQELEDESLIEEGRKTVRISVPSKSIDITIDKSDDDVKFEAGDSTQKGTATVKRTVTVKMENDGKTSVSKSAGTQTNKEGLK